MDEFRAWFGRSRRLLAILLAAALLIIALIGSYYQVEADEVGLVTRFGRFAQISNPGAHGKLPFSIPEGRRRAMTFGRVFLEPGLLVQRSAERRIARREKKRSAVQRVGEPAPP
jgi:regulator of protease activity HflC (stomatin/prohibitin superfamily)